jgi:anti-repressor protein
MSEKQSLILVKNVDGKPLSSSRTIAHVFEKDHADVLKKIRKMKMSNDFRIGNYTEGTYQDSNGDKQPRFLMTRDGCAMLVMGFTGEAAMEWKEKFIAAFNAMEKELLAQVQKLPQSYKEALIALVSEIEAKEKLQLELKEAEPKIAFAEHMEKTPDTISIGDFAKHLCKNGYETGEKRLFQKFRDLKYFKKKGKVNIPYQHVIGYKWFIFDEFTKDVTLNGTGEIKKQLCQKIMVTGKGQVSITKILLRELEK